MATIDKRVSKTGKVSWRARVRLYGMPDRTKSFRTKLEAQQWAKGIETDIARGADMPTKDAQTKTVADMVNRYIETYLPFKDHNKDAKKTEITLKWWKERIGAYSPFNVSSALITEVRDELRAGKTYRNTQRSPQTVNRYLAALSHCFKIAVKEWNWLNRPPMENVGRYSEGKGRVRYLSGSERERLLEACRG